MGVDATQMVLPEYRLGISDGGEYGDLDNRNVTHCKSVMDI